MAKRNVTKTSFNGGVQSPLLHGMIDAPKGASSFQASENMNVLKYGPATRRGASEFTSPIHGITGVEPEVQLVPFNYNDEQAYILEFSGYTGGRLRVYKDRGIVLDSDAARTQSISAIAQPVGEIFNVTVADSSGYTSGRAVVFSGIDGATELNGQYASVQSKPNATTVAVSMSGSGIPTLPDFSTGTTTGTITEVYEISIPYSDSDMFDSDGTFKLDVRQYNDVMYIVHPDHHPKILTRAGDDDWSIVDAEMKTGPYLPTNADTQKKLDFTQWERGLDSGGTEIEGYWYCKVRTRIGDYSEEGDFDLFATTDVQAVDTRDLADGTIHASSVQGTATSGPGRYLTAFVPRYSYFPVSGAHAEPKDFIWHHFRIAKYISATEAIIERSDDDRAWPSQTSEEVGNPPDFRTRKFADWGAQEWALGAVSETSGFPSVVEIHDGRLVIGKTTSEPDTLHLSEVGGYSTTGADFRTVDDDGQVYDDLGFNVNISGGNASPIQWVSSSSNGLLVGTYSSEGVISANDLGKGFVPGNVSYRRNTTVGSKSIQPLMLDQSTLFVSRTGRRVHEMVYDISTTGQQAKDLTERAEHVTKTGIVDIAFQREPIDTVWCVLSNGKLISFTFDKNNEIDAWTQHEIGGQFTGSNLAVNEGKDSVVTSVAVIPSTDGSSDEVWISVNREGNKRVVATGAKGASVVFPSVEILSNIYDEDTGIVDARYYDGYISSSTTVTNLSVSSTGSVAPGTYSDGDVVFFSNIVPDGTLTQDPDNQYYRYDINTFTFKSIYGNDLDFGNSFTADTQPTTTTFSGVERFFQKSLPIYVDGRDLGAQTIVAGSNTLANGAYGANITIGYPYTSYIELKNLEGSGLQNPDQGKVKRVTKIFLRLLNSLGLKHGDSAANLTEEQFDSELDVSDFKDLVTGDFVFDFDGDYEKSGVIRLQGDGPYPLTIQSLVAEMEVEGYVSNQ